MTAPHTHSQPPQGRPDSHSLINAGVELMADWQQIETAPKDGSQMLLFAEIPEIEGLGFGGPVIITGYWDGLDEAWCSTLSTFSGPFVTPSHWMPLPAAPKIQHSEGEGR